MTLMVAKGGGSSHKDLIHSGHFVKERKHRGLVPCLKKPKHLVPLLVVAIRVWVCKMKLRIDPN